MHSAYLGNLIKQFINNKSNVRLLQSKKDKIFNFITHLTNDYNTETLGHGQVAGIRVYLVDYSNKNNPKILIKSALIYNRHEAQEYISKLRNSNICLQETMGFTQTDVYYNMKEESDESILQRFKAE